MYLGLFITIYYIRVFIYTLYRSELYHSLKYMRNTCGIHVHAHIGYMRQCGIRILKYIKYIPLSNVSRHQTRDKYVSEMQGYKRDACGIHAGYKYLQG